jgi:hypothetical protein
LAELDRDEIYARWSADRARWSRWVKPVLFAHVADPPQTGKEPPRPPLQAEALLGPREGDPYRAPSKSLRELAVIVDLPGALSVGAGLALAALGFQPVPLYNSVPSARSYEVALDMWPVVYALIAGAPSLQPPKSDAPPAFLLDARRMTRTHAGARFDNTSFCSWTDLPSAEVRRQSGIGEVVLLGEGAPKWDLGVPLLRWQEAGIPLYQSSGIGERSPLTIRGPSWWLSLRHWFNRAGYATGAAAS